MLSGRRKLQDCKKRNILYESSCEVCNPEEEGRDRKSHKLSGGEGVYVGEIGRSLYDRAGEHIADARSRNEDSHMVKHWAASHPEMETAPKCKLKIIASFQDALTRQISESVRIDMRGGGILNSKTEYSRFRLPRLVIDREEWKQSKKEEKKALEKNEDTEETDLETVSNREMDTENDTNRMETKRKKGKAGNEQSKRRKLEPLVDLGEEKVEGQEEIPSSWFSSSLEEGDTASPAAADWRKLPNIQPEPKLKQLELNFSKILEKLDSKESTKKSGEDEKLKESKNDQANKPKLKKDQHESKTDMKSVYKLNTGKISKKESIAIAAILA